jgi:septal ring factor EnvC (AmiA/AmiB activator)
MLVMSPLSQAPMSSLTAWHAEQTPLVRALAAPVVDEMTVAMRMMQTAVDERDRLLVGFSAQLQASQTQLTDTQTQFADTRGQLKDAQGQLVDTQEQLTTALVAVGELTSKLETTTDRIDVLERKTFGRSSEKRKPKMPDAMR